MKDVFGNDLPIVEGHEQALWFLGAWVFLTIIYVGLRRHWKDVRRILQKPRTLRPFNERDYDPYQDDNNLGRQ